MKQQVSLLLAHPHWLSLLLRPSQWMGLAARPEVASAPTLLRERTRDVERHQEASSGRQGDTCLGTWVDMQRVYNTGKPAGLLEVAAEESRCRPVRLADGVDIFQDSRKARSLLVQIEGQDALLVAVVDLNVL